MVGCWTREDLIVDFQKGSVVAWTILNDDNFSPPLEKDCAKAFSTQDGLISVFQTNENNYITTLIWGGRTSQSEIDSHPLHIDSVTGRKSSSIINSSNLIAKQLVIETEDNGGSKSKFTFSRNDNEKNQLIYNGFEYIEASEEERRRSQFLKAQFPSEEVKLSYCTADSFEMLTSPLDDSSLESVENIASVSSYVLGKKWSIDDMNCKYRGGYYQVFTTRRPSGRVLYSGGVASEIERTMFQTELSEISNTQFTLFSRVHAGDYVKRILRRDNVISGDFKIEINLINPKKIEYKVTIKQINLNASLNGTLQYDEIIETGFGRLCD